MIPDLYSGKSHFIILLKKNNKIGKLINHIYDFPYSLLLEFIKYYNNISTTIGANVLSIHLGNFQSKTSPHFHAHLYVPIDTFIRLTSKKLDIDKWSHNIISQGKLYKKLDLKSISKYKNNLLKLPILPNGFKYSFHPNQPRLTIYRKKSASIEEMFIMLFYIAFELKLYKKHIGGAHLVINNHMNFDPKFKTIGYLQIDPANYYHLLPTLLQKTWLKNFKNTEYLIYT
jgi:hypothetical protein